MTTDALIFPIDTADRLLADQLGREREAALLRPFGFSDPAVAARNLRHLAPDDDSRQVLAEGLAELLRECADAPDADRALNSIERIGASTPERFRFLRTIVEDAAATHLLCQVTGSSQYFADTLIAQPHLVGWLRSPGVLESPLGSSLVRELAAELHDSGEVAQWPAVMRRFKNRHMLRIGAMDLLGTSAIEQLTAEISALADAEVEAALSYARAVVGRRFSPVLDANDRPVGMVVLGLGKLGGYELNYSSDIDLIVIFAEEGRSPGGQTSGREYFARITREMVRVLDEITADGQVFRTDMRLRPNGSHGELALSYDRTLNYYQTVGRTWERQALLKARPVAGDIALGRRFLRAIRPFVFRKYLTLESIGEIRKLKNVMEDGVRERGLADRGVKQGIGGIRDIEFTVQFLQLLHGGQYPQLAVTGTLAAARRLQRAQILTESEAHVLGAAYRFLRDLEHRLQITHDLQRYALPKEPEKLRFIARQMGYRDTVEGSALESFEQKLQDTQQKVRRVFQRLFGTGFDQEGAEADALTELILAPQSELEGEPSEAALRIIGHYGLQNKRQALKRLADMSREESVLLKTTRTRTNLAKCAPALFEALSRTPDPDLALGQFQRIVDSIGAKSLFYELLGETPSMLNMVVQLAVFSEFLTELLVRHPGMLDELMDSLQTGRARSHDEMAEDLSRLLEGAVDPDIILKSWQAGELLRIGTRDLLHAANLGETFRELTALAEVILEATVHRVWHSRGDPQQAFGGRFAVIGLGKLGGREMTYGSDLDLIMVHEGGSVAEAGRFVYLGQVLMRNISAVTEHGKLYDLDMRLRPMGRNSPLVPSLGRYREYARTSLQFWERLALTRARCVAGDPEFGKQVETFCRNVALGLEEAIHDDAMLSPEAARREVAHMRARIQESAPRESLKKGHGGLVDIEFIVQTLQVIHGAEHPKVRTTNTYDALHAIHAAGLLSDQTYSKLLDAYRFLRMVESRLRIVHGSSAERLPQQPEQLELLARRAGYESADETAAAQMLLDEYRYHTQTTRSIFEDLIGPPA